MRIILSICVAAGFLGLSHSSAEEKETAEAKSTTMALPPWTVTAQQFQELKGPSGKPTVTRVFGNVTASAAIDGVVPRATGGRAVCDHTSRMLTLYFNASVTRGRERIVATDPTTQIILHPDGKMDFLGPHHTEVIEVEP